MTMTLVQTIEVGSGGAASIEFTNIPQTADADLLLLVSARPDTGSVRSYRVHLNSETSGTNYSQLTLEGDGSSAYSTSESNQDRIIFYVAGGTTANTYGSTQLYFSNYAGSTAKSISIDNVTENNATSAFQQLHAARWNNTSAISTITISDSSVNTLQYSIASLYIVTPGDSGQLAAPKATGGTISYSGGYWVHTFTSSGTFTPTEALTDVEYLVVAGGGGGGGFDLVSYNRARGSNGSSSSFSSITTVGGGGGACTYGASGDRNGLSGGSGGGGSYDGSSGTGGSGTANQGYAGGNGGGSYYNGGGGGSGSVGQMADSSHAGYGGNGVTSSITGTSIARAGGGGGGSGSSTSSTRGLGYAGGGDGGYDSAGSHGTANYGGGGGGGHSVGAGGGAGGYRTSVTGATSGGGAAAEAKLSLSATPYTVTVGAGGNGGMYGSNRAGGNGGSGIVIVRYAA